MTLKRTLFTLSTVSLLGLSSCVGNSFDHEIAQKFYDTQDFYYLSPSNSALASSILFNKSTEDAQEIESLINNKGFPDALSVRTIDPFTIVLAYKKTKQSYVCSKGEQGWIITGPEKLDKKIVLPLSASDDKKYSKKSLSASPTIKNNQPTKITIARQSPSPTPVLSPTELSKVKALVASLGKDPATLLTSGDITHEVSVKGESLDSVALWYTFDPSTAKTIRRINQLKSSKLTVGTKITIPGYLVHNNLKYNPEFQKSFGSN
jgi:hypothetical protein